MSQRRRKIANVAELPSNGSYVIEDIDGQEIAVFRVDDEYYAVLNYCVHQAGPLCETGELMGQMTAGTDGWEWEYDESGTIVECPWHSWKFNITTGTNIHDDRYKVPTFDVEVEDGEIFILK